MVRGSAAIYGCEGPSPSFFTEQMARRLPLRTRFQRDISELEGYFENFARRHPRLVCCMLRYQPEIGPDLDMPLVRYLSLPVVPTQLGFDPRLQLLHADDATGALEAATRNPVRGAVNVAPSGSISLSHILRLARRPSLPIPHPLFGPALERLGRQLGAGPVYGDGVRLLRFGRGVDNRRLRDRDRLRAQVRRRGRRPRLRRQEPRAAAIGPSLHPGDLAGRLAGVGEVSARGRRPDAPRAPNAEALADFLRRMRLGIEDGLDPGTPLSARRVELPKTLRDAVERLSQRLRGEYHEDEWGFDEQFAEAVYPAVRVPLRHLVEGGGRRGPPRARRTAGRCWSPTTRARCSPSTPR